MEYLLESPEQRSEAYRQRAEAAVISAASARSEKIAAYYSHLAECWGKLAATVQPATAAGYLETE